MHDQSPSPVLIPTAKDDPELQQLLSEQDTLPFMSETRAYGVPMIDALVFRIMLEDQIIGEAALKTIRWFNRKAELSVYMLPEYRSRNYGRKVLEDLIELAFGKLALFRLEAEIYEYNGPSIRLAEKLGFVMEGRLRKAKFYNGQYYDILCYGLLKNEYKKGRY